MYVLEAEIRDLRSIRHLLWRVDHAEAPGWHVLLGDNGSGKSTVLRALALAFVGADDAKALRQPFETWIRRGSKKATVALRLARDKRFDGSNGREKIELSIHESGTLRGGFQAPAGSRRGGFSAAYGPYRRFLGTERQEHYRPHLARHLSLFDESFALTECLQWLRTLRYEALEGAAESTALLDRLTSFINQEGFLPFGARLKEISSAGVTFVDGNGFDVPVEDLGDGYRSILSMTFELIRQLALEDGPEALFSADDPGKIVAPGVVLVDEIDAHLHPTWQRRVGLWFRDHFPKVQFIVTTHSPLVCQASQVGTVFYLPRPGRDEEPRRLAGQELDRLLYGNILDAYGTGIFGEGITRSAPSRQLLERLAQLNQKEIDEGLTEGEQEEQVALRATLPTAAYRIKKGDAARS